MSTNVDQTTSNAENSFDSSQSSTINRQSLIDTAVRFLQNPKVVPTPIENKRIFLAKKGLTDSEIEVALKNAGAYNTSNLQPVQAQTFITNNPPPAVLNYSNLRHSESVIFRISKWIANILFAGCVAFTVYKLIVKKYFLKQKSKAQLELETMHNINKQLQDSIQDMRITLNGLKGAVDNMSNTIVQMTMDKNGHSNDSDIKAEIQSVKSLLLNRTQFPAIPTVTPILPTWQLGSNKSEKKSSELKTEENLSIDIIKVDKRNGLMDNENTSDISSNESEK